MTIERGAARDDGAGFHGGPHPGETRRPYRSTTAPSPASRTPPTRSRSGSGRRERPQAELLRSPSHHGHHLGARNTGSMRFGPSPVDDGAEAAAARRPGSPHRPRTIRPPRQSDQAPPAPSLAWWKKNPQVVMKGEASTTGSVKNSLGSRQSRRSGQRMSVRRSCAARRSSASRGRKCRANAVPSRTKSAPNAGGSAEPNRSMIADHHQRRRLLAGQRNRAPRCPAPCLHRTETSGRWRSARCGPSGPGRRGGGDRGLRPEHRWRRAQAAVSRQAEPRSARDAQVNGAARAVDERPAQVSVSTLHSVPVA